MIGPGLNVIMLSEPIICPKVPATIHCLWMSRLFAATGEASWTLRSKPLAAVCPILNALLKEAWSMDQNPSDTESTVERHFSRVDKNTVCLALVCCKTLSVLLITGQNIGDFCPALSGRLALSLSYVSWVCSRQYNASTSR